jgi:hypothetical protein
LTIHKYLYILKDIALRTYASSNANDSLQTLAFYKTSLLNTRGAPFSPNLFHIYQQRRHLIKQLKRQRRLQKEEK